MITSPGCSEFLVVPGGASQHAPQGMNMEGAGLTQLIAGEQLAMLRPPARSNVGLVIACSAVLLLILALAGFILFFRPS